MQKPQKKDLISGFFVFLIALPLCMGISMASGFPAIAGIMTAIVGGCVSSFLGSSRLTIKGPAAGLIVIAIAAVQELGQGDMALGYRRCLAVGVVAAILQICFALRRMGSLSEFIPPSVVHGMLAAIGLIIIAKQIHILLGVVPSGKNTLDLFLEIPNSLMHINPEVFAIGAISLVLLFALPLLRGGWAKKVPAPLFAILLAIPFSIYFDFDHLHHYKVFGETYSIGPDYLINLPGSILQGISWPDFSTITSFTSLKYIIMFALVGTVESLLTVSAVDALDPLQQSSNLNKDLFAVGVGNLVASCIGGLPMISEIVRSKNNIDNGAATYWANVSHGIFLLIFVAFFPDLLHLIPLAVLSAMLVYTGYRLASPRTFIHTYHMGRDQMIVFAITFGVTIASDLLIGVATGMIVKILIHKLRGAQLKELFVATTQQHQSNGVNIIDVQGPSVFSNYLSLRKSIRKLTVEPYPIEVNFRKSTIIDLTVQTKLESLQREIGAEKLQITGLEHHRALSDYQNSTKLL